MKIIIIGAGLAGLSAATRLAQLHHEVIVLEKRPTLSPRGGSLSTRPGASRVLKSWGLEAEMDRISNTTEGIIMRDLKTGEVRVAPPPPRAAAQRTDGKGGDEEKAPHWGTTREELISLFYDKAVEYGAEVRFDSDVAKVEDDEHGARVILHTGAVLHAGLVLVADGIKSRLRSQVLADIIATLDGEKGFEMVVSDITGFGFKLDTRELDVPAQEGISRLTENVSSNIWISKGDAGAGRKCFAVTRYSAKAGYVAVLAHTIDPRNADQTSLWDDKGDMGYIRDAFHGSCTAITKALDMAGSCDRWRLADLPILPRWTSKEGRVALMGDCAHAMHPSVGQGFSQILEDIGVLSALFVREEARAKESGKPLESAVPGIMKAWQDIRKPRVDKVWEYSRWSTKQIRRQVGGEASADADGKTRDVNGDTRCEDDFRTPEFVAWSLDYDVEKEVAKYYNSQSN